MSQHTHLRAPSETQLWVSWVLALTVVIALAAMFVTGVVVLAGGI